MSSADKPMHGRNVDVPPLGGCASGLAPIALCVMLMRLLDVGRSSVEGGFAAAARVALTYPWS